MSDPGHDTCSLRVYVLQLERRLEDRFAFTENATSKAFEANNERLHTMNEMRSAMADQSALKITRTEAMAAIGAIDERTRVAMANMGSKLDAVMRPNFMLWMAFGSVLCSLFTGLWWVGSLRIDASTTPAMLGIQELRARIEGLDRRAGITEDAIRVNSAKFFDAIAVINSEITRLNVWSDFMHAKTFPGSPVPPMKQP